MCSSWGRDPTSTIVIHGLIPLLLLLSIPWIDRRKVWLMWPLTELADIDYFLGRHRATGHNVWILLPFAIALGYALYVQHRERVEWMSIALTFLASHLILDIFQGGATIFYPFSLHTPCYYAEINVVTATNTPVLYFEKCSFEGVPTVSEIYNYLPSNEAAFLAFLAPAALVVGVIHWTTRRRRGDEKAT